MVGYSTEPAKEHLPLRFRTGMGVIGFQKEKEGYQFTYNSWMTVGPIIHEVAGIKYVESSSEFLRMSKLAEGALRDKKTHIPSSLLCLFHQVQALQTPDTSNLLCQNQQKGKTYISYKFHRHVSSVKVWTKVSPEFSLSNTRIFYTKRLCKLSEELGLKWNTDSMQEEGSNGHGTLQGREITAVRRCEDTVSAKTLKVEGGGVIQTTSDFQSSAYN